MSTLQHTCHHHTQPVVYGSAFDDVDLSNETLSIRKGRCGLLLYGLCQLCHEHRGGTAFHLHLWRCWRWRLCHSSFPCGALRTSTSSWWRGACSARHGIDRGGDVTGGLVRQSPLTPDLDVVQQFCLIKDLARGVTGVRLHRGKCSQRESFQGWLWLRNAVNRDSFYEQSHPFSPELLIDLWLICELLLLQGSYGNLRQELKNPF
mmetsp:Transcript_28813/g.67054  ORF Transcript_28813/g.67054 Transcript_28813/m.67054 type:complete len:205 (+) Transcript_28813:4146-4760(+)